MRPASAVSPSRARASTSPLPKAEFPSRPSPSPRPAPEAVALVLQTSGTTARPKTVPLTHANLAASAASVARSLALAPADCGLVAMPLFHIHGLVAGLLAPLAAGGAVACPGDFNAFRFFDWLDAFRPSWYTAVPTMHQLILARAARHADALARARLRFVRSSSAPLPPVVLERIEAAFRAPMIEAYGMTEASHQMAAQPLPPGLRKPGSVGRPAGVDLVVLDPDGATVSTGEHGEIAVRGPGVTAGYEANPEANAAAFTADGWFRTGDEGYLDADGYLFLTGRLKELINRGGEKIAPREVEEVILRHPAVRQAVCFALPHATLGEEVAAAVVRAEGAGAAALPTKPPCATSAPSGSRPSRCRAPSSSSTRSRSGPRASCSASASPSVSAWPSTPHAGVAVSSPR